MALPVAYKIGTNANYGNVVARGQFTPQQQAVMDAGGNYAGYAVVDGHFTYVGAGRSGADARAVVFPDAPLAPNKAGGSWMDGPAGVAADVTGVPAYNAPVTQAAPKDTSEKDAQNRDAFALIKGTLAQYGLPDSLAGWAWGEIVQGKSSAEVLLELRQRPEFKAEFPEIDARLKAGLAPLSPGEIVTYRQQARQMMRAAGMPEGFFDSKGDFSDFLTKDLSLKELGDRISGAAHAMYASDPTDREEWRRLGFGDGDIAALWLNPDVAQPLLEKRTAAAQLSGTAVRAGFGGLTQNEALDLAGQGVSQQQAQQGFGQIVHDKELFGALDSGEDQITRQEQLMAGVGGSAYAQNRIEQRARRRKAAFSGGGGFAGGQTGLTGLGGSDS